MRIGALIRRCWKSECQAVGSVKGISIDQLFEIYERQCWEAVKGDQLPAGVDFAVFDGAVKSGRNNTGGVYDFRP